MTREEVEQLLRASLPSKDQAACSLCGGPVAYAGIFAPTKSFAKRIGQPEGKYRIVVYALCEDCFALPEQERMDRVEAWLLATLSVQ
jgi:hypothetical protein